MIGPWPGAVKDEKVALAAAVAERPAEEAREVISSGAGEVKHVKGFVDGGALVLPSRRAEAAG